MIEPGNLTKEEVSDSTEKVECWKFHHKMIGFAMKIWLG